MANIINSYAWFYNGLDSLAKAQKIHFVGEFVETKGKNVISEEIQEYLHNLKQVTTKEDLEIIR